MKIQRASKEEIGLLIVALRAIYVEDVEDVRIKLLAQLENELLTRFSLKQGPVEE